MPNRSKTVGGTYQNAVCVTGRFTEAETLCAELADAFRRRASADEEGRNVIDVQMKQILRDLEKRITI